jgi:hypothetical protein
MDIPLPPPINRELHPLTPHTSTRARTSAFFTLPHPCLSTAATAGELQHLKFYPFSICRRPCLMFGLRVMPCHHRRDAGMLSCHCLPHRRPSVRPSSRYPLCCREAVNLARRPLELDVAAKPHRLALATSSESQRAPPCPASHRSVAASPS